MGLMTPRILFRPIFIVSFLIVTGLAQSSFGERAYQAGECLLQFEESASRIDVTAELASYNATLAYSSALVDWHLVTVDPDLDVVEVCAELADLPFVRQATPNAIAYTFFDPDDSYYDRQWNLFQVIMDESWGYATTNSDVTVAVLDTGDYPDHPDLIDARRVAGYDTIEQDNDPTDPGNRSHGAHVISMISATVDNGIGIAGMAANCRYMPVRVLDTDQGTALQIAEGVTYAKNFGANVINMSFGFALNSDNTPVDPGPALANAIDDAADAGIILVAATGNFERPAIPYPAFYDDVISVGATDANRNRADYSNYGAGLDVMAPGGNRGQDLNSDGDPDGIWGASRVGDAYDYYQLDGTSQAAPHVSALAALLLANDLNAADVAATIRETATDLGPDGYDQEYGYGLVNFRAALAVTGDPGPIEPDDVMLQMPYPNPFQAETQLSFFLPDPSKVTIRVYNVVGQRVRTVLADVLPSGWHFASWNGRDDDGDVVASGVYFCQLDTSHGTEIKSLVFLK